MFILSTVDRSAQLVNTELFKVTITAALNNSFAIAGIHSRIQITNRGVQVFIGS